MRFDGDERHPLEKYKEDEQFDEDVGGWLSEKAGITSPEEIKKYIEDVRRDVNSEMRNTTDKW